MTKVVLDTNNLISATFWKGPSNEITLLAAKQQITAYTSIEIVNEYARILERDFKQSKSQIQEKVSGILSFSKIVDPKVKIDAVKEDSSDNKIVEAAVEADADYIVSGDKHLLKLHLYKKIQIVTAREFLEKMKKT